MALELRQLRHLLAVAEHRSFGRAAAALGITQPALSRSVKGIEDEVGAELFERSAGGVTPTDHGRLLMEQARAVVYAADELERELLRRRIPGAGQVVLGAGPYPGETIVPAALARFAPRNPLVRARVVIRGDWDELLRRLRGRELEFFVAETSTLDGEHDLDVEPLAPHPVYFVARSDHPLAHRTVADTAHTFAYPFLALSRHPPRVLRPMLATRRQSLQPPGLAFPAIELPSLGAVKRVLASSDAIAPLPLPCVADEVERGTLVLLGTEPWLYTGYGLVGLKGRAPSAAARDLLSCIREAEATLVREESRLVARHSLAPPLAGTTRPGKRARGS